MTIPKIEGITTLSLPGSEFALVLIFETEEDILFDSLLEDYSINWVEFSPGQLMFVILSPIIGSISIERETLSDLDLVNTLRCGLRLSSGELKYVSHRWLNP